MNLSNVSQYILLDQKRLTAAAPWLIVGAVWLVFGRTITFDIVNWDDPVFLVSNEYVSKGIGLAGVKWAFQTMLNGMWHPITWMSFMAEVSLFGDTPATFHTTNLWLHVLNSLLIFKLVQHVVESKMTCLASALLFAIHPLNVESVAWIAERKGLLSQCFILLVLISYVTFLQSRNRLYYVGSVFLSACAVMSKSNALCIPFLLYLIDLTLRIGGFPNLQKTLNQSFLDRYRSCSLLEFSRSRILALLPFLSLGALCALLTVWSEREANAVSEKTIAYTFCNIVSSYWNILSHAVWPRGLAALYPAPEIWDAAAIIGKTAVLVPLFYWIVRNARRHPNLFFVACWYVITLAPVSGIVRFGPHYIADRYAYLSLIAPFAGLAAWLRLQRAFVLPLAISTLAIVAAVQVEYWNGSDRLWQRVIFASRRAPDSLGAYIAPAFNNLGTYLDATGKTKEAETCYKESLAASPNPEAIINLAKSEERKHNFNHAMAYLQGGIKQLPMNPLILTELGKLFETKGDPHSALTRYEEALFADPLYYQANEQVALLLLSSRDPTVRDEFRGYKMAQRSVDLNPYGPNPILVHLLKRPHVAPNSSVSRRNVEVSANPNNRL